MCLVDGAERAHPVGGEVFELGARSNTIIGVALSGVILIPADVANILFHIIVVFKVNISKFQSAKIRLFFYMDKNIFTSRTTKAQKNHGKRHKTLAVMK